MSKETLTERRKRVLRQAEEARKNDKIYPLEIYQATAEKGYDERGPFAEHTQNIQQKNMGTRQARQYWLQHDLDLMEERRKQQKKKKQNEIADRLLRKGR